MKAHIDGGLWASVNVPFTKGLTGFCERGDSASYKFTAAHTR